jgi:hypothetical protein
VAIQDRVGVALLGEERWRFCAKSWSTLRAMSGFVTA